MVETGALEMGHARALLALAPAAAVALGKQAAAQEWSVREVERRVQLLGAGRVPTAPKRATGKATPSADIATLERELGETLGTRVDVQPGRAGRGKLVIHYSDLDMLDGVLARLRS
jgi:ParB family chromosome partitioning protein